MEEITDAGNALPVDFFGAQFHPEKRALLDQCRALTIRNQWLEEALHATGHHIDQTLGAALHYPRYCDDQKSFPGATEADGVCTGDHVSRSLASEAARTITVMEGMIEGYQSKAARPGVSLGRFRFSW